MNFTEMRPYASRNPSRMHRPKISIVIPAYNSAETLDRAVASVVAQTEQSWEIILVDDGSLDDTPAIAQRWADADARIRTLRQPNRGASAARNVGLAHAQGQWIGFLDSDDWFDPTFMAKLLEMSAKWPDAGVVYCNFALVDEHGSMEEQQNVPLLSDPFGVLARSCDLSITCALIRAEILSVAGNFDESLRLNEDWDLWQRVARVCMDFKGISETLVYYYRRPGSLSKNPRLLAEDGLTVIERMFNADPKVVSINPRYRNGLPLEEKPSMLLDWVTMCAGNAIALGEDGDAYLDYLIQPEMAFIQPAATANDLAGALAFARCTDPQGLRAFWDELEPRIERFWARLRVLSRQARAVETARFMMVQGIWREDFWAREFHSDMLQLARVNIAKVLPDIISEGRDTIMIEVCRDNVHLGWLSLPGGGNLPAETIRTAVMTMMVQVDGRRALMRQTQVMRQPGFWICMARDAVRSRGWGLRARAMRPSALIASLGIRGRAILGLAFAKQMAGAARDEDDGGERWQYLQDMRQDAEAEFGDPLSQSNEQKQEDVWRDLKVNSPEYWDQVFENPDPWAYDSIYEQTKYDYTLELVGDDKPRRALELACAEGHFTVQLASKVETLLATDISKTALGRAAQRSAHHANISYAQLDFFNTPLPGMFDLIVCSEVLYEAPSLNRLRAIARNIADHLNPGGALVMAHVIEVSEEKERSGFDWDGAFGAKTIAAIFSAIPGLTLETQLETELYRIHRYRKAKSSLASTDFIARPIKAPPDPEYVAYVSWGGAVKTRKEVASERAVNVPVLMYHRIAQPDAGPASLAHYRVSPQAFEAQLRWLRQNGYYSIAPRDLAAAIREARALPGRPVLLTFDDGYQDFATTAWPLLQHYGLTATVGVIADKVGGYADWDARFGDAAALMTWDDVIRIKQQGADIASHSATHRALTAISAQDVVNEAVRSAAALKTRLGSLPDAIIYPYGLYDALVGQTCALAGYEIGFGTGPGVASLLSPIMHVPRIDVNAFDDLDYFVKSLQSFDPQTGRVRS